MRTQNLDSKVMIKTPRLMLRPFSEDEVTPQYVAWLNERENARFLNSCIDKKQDMRSVKEWVRSSNTDASRMLLGIFKDNEHIGNITFYLIDNLHKCLRVGLSIGRSDLKGQGYGTEALAAAVKYVFEDMKFNRIEAGIHRENDVSIRLFVKVGFHHEATFKKRLIFEGKFVDMLLYVLLRDDFAGRSI